ncbi:MAG: hypothetical protein R3F11_17815 [Verrucomicrobiales bacterium]
MVDPRRTSNLVFIDPVSTGFSRAEKGGPEAIPANEDLESVGEFVRLYVTRHGRWASPKYPDRRASGGLRAAALSNHLQDRYGTACLNGVVLLSAVLDFETLQGGDLAYISFLPGFAATAAYHRQLAGDLNGKPADAAKPGAGIRAGRLRLSPARIRPAGGPARFDRQALCRADRAGRAVRARLESPRQPVRIFQRIAAR